MAIKIPSKKIYNPRLSLIRDNRVGEVSSGIKHVSPDNKVGQVVYSTKVEGLTADGFPVPNVSQDEAKTTNSLDYERITAATLAKVSIGNSSLRFDIKRQSDEYNLISKVYYDNDNPIYNVFFRKTLYRITAQYNPSSDSFNFNNETATKVSETEEYGYDYDMAQVDSNYSTQSSVDIRKFYCTISPSTEASSSYKITAKTDVAFFELGYGGGRLESVSVAEEPFELSNTFSQTSSENYINVSNIIVPTFITVDLMYSRISDTAHDLNKNYTAEGYRIVFEPIKVDVSIYGDTLSISAENKVDISSSGGTGKPISLKSNEIIQSGNTIGGNKAHKDLSSKILNQYANGKETMRITCAVDDYYEYTDDGTLGDLKISREGDLPMLFQNGDIVVPMRYRHDGNDEPFSIGKNGAAKRFAVVSERVYYDGAVWQELYLQEYTESV